MSKCNSGVKCNVCHCEHNENGCDCKLDKIEVCTNGENEPKDKHHFCKSFKQK